MKSSIVGFALNYSNEKIAPFLNSLNATGFDGDLVLYVNNNSKINSSGYKFRVILFNFEKKQASLIFLFKAIRKLFKNSLYKILTGYFNKALLHKIQNKKPLSEPILAFFYAGYFLMTSRFLLYYNLVVNSDYDQIFFTDVNDVVFQGNIFSELISPGVYSFQENAQVMLQDNFHNIEWIIFGYGMQTYWDMRHQVVKCAGTILGTRKELLLFLQDFLREIAVRRLPPHMIGIDQGVYNYLLHCSANKYFIEVPNGKIVYTVGSVDENDIEVVGKDIVARDNSMEIPVVVHQYNRHKSLTEFVNRVYRLSV